MTSPAIGTLHRRDVLRVFTRPPAELKAEIKAVLPDSEAVGVEVTQGVVTLRGRVPCRSQARALTETVRAIEGVVDVISEVAGDEDDLLVVPPLL